jgi:hypothetical protein
MQSNPYSPPKAPLSEPPKLLRNFRTAVAPAIFSFLAIPAFAISLSLIRRVAIPDFLWNTGFIESLAGCCIVGSLVVALAPPKGWLRYLVSTLVAAGLLIGAILLLVVVAR